MSHATVAKSIAANLEAAKSKIYHTIAGKTRRVCDGKKKDSQRREVVRLRDSTAVSLSSAQYM